MRKNVKRWLGLGVSAAVAASLLAGCGETKNTAAAPAKEKERPFAGKKLNVVLANHPWGEAIKTLIPDFEAATGMKVEFQNYFEDQLTQKMTVQFTAQSTTPDVFMYRPSQEGRLFFKNGWVEPLDGYVNKDPSYDFADFAKSSIGSTTVDNKVTGIPIITEQEVLFYRKDVLQKAGLQVPKTLDELEEAAKKLNDPSNGFYGFVARGQRGPLVSQLSSYVFSEGGDYMQGNKATLNTPEAIKAFTRYGTMLKNYGPPGVLNMSWPQAMGVFTQGKAAFYTDASSLYGNAADKEKSAIFDKVGYALFPAGKAGAKPFNITSWGLAINAKSVNKDAAWEFVKWATSKEIVLKTQSKGNPGARTSVWNSQDGTAAFPKELVDVIKESSKIGVGYNRPIVTKVSEASDIVGAIVVKAITGENVNDAAEKANQELQAMIDKENGK